MVTVASNPTAVRLVRIRFIDHDSLRARAGSVARRCTTVSHKSKGTEMPNRHHNPIDVQVEHRPDGEVGRASIRFGPHHIVEVRDDGERVSFSLVYTHHGFAVDASEPGGELERIVEEVRRAHPEAMVD